MFMETLNFQCFVYLKVELFFCRKRLSTVFVKYLLDFFYSKVQNNSLRKIFSLNEINITEILNASKHLSLISHVYLISLLVIFLVIVRQKKCQSQSSKRKLPDPIIITIMSQPAA